MELQNFCFAYKKREPKSLDIPNAKLPVGETIAIIGLNGAGKSTLARCICGLEKKCGILQIDGKSLDWKARLKHCYMMRYLQHDAIRGKGLAHFDCWASTFGETQTAIELAPEGYTLIGR